MATTLSVYGYFSANVNGSMITGGSLQTPIKEITLTGEVFDKTYRVAISTLVELLQAGSANTDDIADFDFLWIETDQALLIQVLINENDSNEIGGVYTIPADGFFLLMDDVGYHGTVANIDTWESTWTADVVDRIECYQVNTNATANVRVVAAT